MNEFNKLKDGLSSEVAVTEVIKSDVADFALKSVAKVRARLRAYENIYANYESYIINESLKLKDGNYSDNTYKELGIARLVAHWVVETEKFLDEEESKLQGIERETRKGFVEESLKVLPDDLRDEVLSAWNEKKQEVLEWFAKKLQSAIKKSTDRSSGDEK